MNTITRIAAHVTIATGIAASALVLGTGAAHAETPNGPGQFQVGPIVDPEGPQIANPTPTPDLPVPPKPKDPNPGPESDAKDEIADAPNCTHGCGGGNEVPDDKAGPAPQDEPADNPADDAPLDQGCFTGCDLPEEKVAPADPGVTVPTRVDAGQDAASTDVFTADRSEETGTSYYVGLALFSAAAATGVALAARRRHTKADQA